MKTARENGAAEGREPQPSQIRLFVTLGIILIAVWGSLGFAIARGTLANPFMTGDKEQLATLDTLCSLSYPSELSQAQTHCTKRGFALLKNILGDSADFWPATFKPIRVKTNPKLADIEMVRDAAEGKSHIYVRLLDQGGWKFDDVYIVQRGGSTINQWYSYEMEHPILSFLDVHSDEVLKTTKDTWEVIQALKSLSKDDCGRGRN